MVRLRICVHALGRPHVLGGAGQHRTDLGRLIDHKTPLDDRFVHLFFDVLKSILHHLDAAKIVRGAGDGAELTLTADAQHSDHRL